jgi:hypothetical protein
MDAKTAGAIDVAAFDVRDASNDGREFELLNPFNSAKTGIFITTLGIDSDIAREMRDDQIVKGQRSWQRTGRIALDSPQAQKDKRIDFCVACTRGWRNMVFRGQPLEYSAANARMLYSNVEAILEQVDAAIADKENFSKPLPKA